ncbi:unannotated protein [freshwater metagenome]|uniref:Unannotated protein n=1 Tax=freshwater metagenome TaxID=449393 RepID=A0A6J7LRH5_9ZZZZ|nr:hypothetical protein [Actinomycetota bacterium]MSW26009.1 hypothetical protein [Actinomycetota bacterium]MSW33856.1 hypothetical protein [Actinomycetota bacterium]MSX30841.1 hypothetical protein [Actinomycetota bacterium]MSX50809.1 hypothetical protein [Actinomycetota bacterium]
MAQELLTLNGLSKKTIDSTYKGMPEAMRGKTFAEFLATKPNIFSSGFHFPIATLRKSALDNNLERMRQYCKEVGASLAPHVKTTMSPQIAQMQIDHGAWALTVANFSQARVFLDYGFNRIIIANEIVDPAAIREIGKRNLEPNTQIIFYVDSAEGLSIIREALKTLPQAKVFLFIEIGLDGGRGGIRDIEGAKKLAQEIDGDPHLFVLGVSGFEGIISGADRSAEGLQMVADFCAKIVAAARLVAPYVRTEKIILTAGGSAFFDVVVQEFSKYEAPFHMVLRSGGYVTHDHWSYQKVYPFTQMSLDKQLLPSIELWAQVLTQPEKGLAILNLGKRDVGNDADNPFPVKRFHGKVLPLEAKVDHLNDQHGYLHFGGGQEVTIADVIGLGISHPCTTFDKWKLFVLVDDNYDVVDFIHTFF